MGLPVRTSALIIFVVQCFLSAAVAATTPPPSSMSTAGNCSPIVTDTHGNVTLNINCPSYSGTRLQLRLRTAEIVLKRTQELQRDFFRSSGPTWSDFQGGFHPFAAEAAKSIATALDKYRFHVVEGEFSAWREQFVRFLGWTLATKNSPVYFSDVREWAVSDNLDLDWDRLESSSSVIILENAHYHPDMVRDLLYQVETRTKQLRVIVSVEPTIRTFLERRPYGEDLFVSMPRTTIVGSAIAKQLVRQYAELVLHRPVGTRVVAAFLELGSDEMVDSQSDYDFRTARAQGAVNVWRVAASLRNWDGKSLPDTKSKPGPMVGALDETVGSIASSNTELASLVATVAFFSHYGVSLPRAFFTDRLAFKPEVLVAALERGLITVTETGVILDLPGLSNVLLAAITRNKEVELELARRVGSPDIGNALVREAVRFGIYDYGALVMNLAARPPSIWAVKRAGAFEAVAKLIATDSSPGRVGRALLAFRASGQRTTRDIDLSVDQLLQSRVATAADGLVLLQSIKPRVGELLSANSSLKEVAWLIVGILETDRSAAADAVAALQVSFIGERVSLEEDLGKIGSLLWALERADHSIAARVVSGMDRDLFSARVAAEGAVAKIGWFFEVVASISPAVAGEIVNGIGTDKLRKVDQAVATNDLASVMWGLSSASLPKAQQVFSTLELSDLELRIREEQRSRGLGLLLLAVARINPSMSTALVDAIGAEEFQKRIQAEEDPVNRALLVAGIAAIRSKTSEAIVASSARELDLEIKFQRRQVQKFSTMCPWCMAAAAQAKNRAENLDDASAYFASAYGASTSENFQNNLDVQSLLRFRRYEPDRLSRAIRERLWEHVVSLHNSAKPIEKSAVAQMLFKADAGRFRSWVISASSTTDGAHPLLEWYDFEQDRARSYIQTNWTTLLRLYTRTKETEMQYRLARVLYASDGVAFKAWLQEARTEYQTNPFPVSLLSRLGSVEITPATAAWIRTRKELTPEAAQIFFHIATPSDLNALAKEIGSHDATKRAFARKLLGHGRPVQTRIESLKEAATFLRFALETVPEDAAQLLVGKTPIAELMKSPASVAQALPCERSWLYSEQSKDPDLKPDVGGLIVVLRQLHFFSAPNAVKLDSSQLEECLVTLSNWDPRLGAEFARAVGPDRVFKLLDDKHDIAGLASAIDRSIPSARTKLRNYLASSFARNPGQRMIDLEVLSEKSPDLAKEILGRFDDQTLAKLLGKTEFGDLGRAFKFFAMISADRSRSVLRNMGPSWLASRIRVERNIYPIEEILKTIEGLDPTLTAAAVSQISVDDLKAALLDRNTDFWPKEALVDLAKLAPELIIDTFNDPDVLGKFYARGRETSFVDYSGAAELLRELRSTNVAVWSAIMGKLDIARLAELINAQSKKGDLLEEIYFQPLLDELARFDARLPIELARLSPGRIAPDKLEDLGRDFPVAEEVNK
ncbi:hypothetical protein ABIB90_000484 [Bradyrhizobium sp. JR4.1]|uniref:hypothetical protein n=1 Tax=Bradyrhizobium sp. JR4.1 TaxID=3156372 RepID=UPI003393164A